MKKITKIILSFLLVLNVLCSTNNIQASDNYNALLSQLLGYYINYKQEASTDIERVLKQMEALDYEQAQIHKGLIQEWMNVNESDYVNVAARNEIQEITSDELPQSLLKANSNIEDDATNAIVVLGLVLNDDGTMQDELVGRVQVGYALALQYPNMKVILTGGQGRNGITEAQAMSEWFIEKGFDESRLILESEASDTVNNALLTYNILKENNIDSMILVTSDYHIQRGSMCFNATFAKNALNDQVDYEIIANCGYDTTKNYEAFSTQTSVVTRILGVSAASDVTLSELQSLTIKLNKPYVCGDELDLSVYANYDSNYSKDVTSQIMISNFDATLDANQTIQITYEENGTRICADFALTSSEVTDYDYDNKINQVLNEISTMDLTIYNETSVTLLEEVKTQAQIALNKENVSEEELSMIYHSLLKVKDNLVLEKNENIELENLALNAKVTLNDKGSKGYVLTDGIVDNNYSNSTVSIENSYAIIELPALSSVYEVHVVTYFNISSKWYNWEVLVSEDGIAYESVGSYTTQSNPGSQGYTITLDEVKQAKYVKVQGLNTNNNNLHLVEVSVYGQMDNICLNKAVQASHVRSSSATYSPNNITDGSLANSPYWDSGDVYDKATTTWADLTQEQYPYAIIDLAGLYEIDSINVMTYYNTSRYYQYEVYTSIDGVNFTLFNEKKDTTSSYESQTFIASTKTYANYIKIVGTYNSANPGFHLIEVRASGELISIQANSNLALYNEVALNEGGTNGSVLTDGVISNSYSNSNVAIQDSYAVIELAGLSYLNQVKVITYCNNTSKWYNWEVFISEDGIDYESVGKYEVEANPEYDGITIELDEIKQARYVKVQGLNTNNNYLHLVEIEVYGWMNNICLNKDIEASHVRSGSQYDVKNLVNGSLANATYWDTSDVYDASTSSWNDLTFDQYPYAIIDLGAFYDVETINVMPYYNASRYYQYEVYISENGKDYTLFGTKKDEAKAIKNKTFKQSEANKTRYIKVVGTYNSSNPGFHLSEIRATGNQLAESDADYTLVEQAINKVPQDLSIYTLDSVVELKLMLASVIYDLTSIYQEEVNTYATNIEIAIDNLTFEKISLIDAMKKAQAIDESLYTKASITNVEKSLNEANKVYDTTQTSYDPIMQATTSLYNMIDKLEAKIVVDQNVDQTSKEGYLFAGYFNDEQTTQPNKNAENAYVKWIDEAVLNIKVQLEQNELTSNIRFVTTIDSLYHQVVGFEMSIFNDGVAFTPMKDINTTTVYKNIVSNVDDTLLYNDPTICSYASNYFTTFTLTNIPNDCYDYDIEVKPYFITYDGTKVYGEARTISVNEIVTLYNQ